jgi:hypothetical protein|tara:strand:- start:458 stop:706 length:249 start_codon:yes stop_codon:yes gene_type:complete
MGNMSYCRFENTAGDLEDCVHAIENGEMTVEMSDYEVDALQDLLNHSLSIVAMRREIERAIDAWHEHEAEMERQEEEEEEEE